MSVQKISELLALMQEHDIVELEMEEGDFSIALRKQGAFSHSPIQASVAPPAPAPVPIPVQAAPVSGAKPAEDPSLAQVKSPIVGTFYRAPGPESPPFVDVGAKVGKETVVCIIEAMKIMNEVKAEINGVIERVLVESGEPVEYGQPLFLIRRAGA